MCNMDRLTVPKNEKNWLRSPPGSPPLGWKTTEEDSPNLTALSLDLVSESMMIAVPTKDRPGIVIEGIHSNSAVNAPSPNK